jgi:hypothetical protein
MDEVIKLVCDVISYNLHRERIQHERETFVARFNQRMAKDDWWNARALDRIKDQSHDD